MSTLTAVITHLPPEQVQEGARLIHTVAPDTDVVICYNGTQPDFDRLTIEDKVLLDDPTLKSRGPHLQSMTQVFGAAWEAYFVGDDRWDSLYVIEYDHLILNTDFEGRLRELAHRTRADLLGKACVEATATNQEHYIRFRRDLRLLDHLRRLSVRDDPTRIFSCLGDGIWLTRRALEAYVAIPQHPPCYLEVYVPTLLYHLGFTVVNVDAHSDLYRYVRWLPPIEAGEAMAALAQGAVFLHPVKDQRVMAAVADGIAERGVVWPA